MLELVNDAVDGPVDHKQHGGIVQLDHLFFIEDEAFAKVSWGKKTRSHSILQCQGYMFNEILQSRSVNSKKAALKKSWEKLIQEQSAVKRMLPSIPLHKFETIIRVERLAGYIHFGVVNGELFLNRFYYD